MGKARVQSSKKEVRKINQVIVDLYKMILKIDYQVDDIEAVLLRRVEMTAGLKLENLYISQIPIQHYFNLKNMDIQI